MQGAWMSVLGGCRSEDIQDLGYELPRIPIPRTPVNKGKRKGRGAPAPALKQLNPLCLSACLVDGLYALALVLEAEFLVTTPLAVSLRLRSSTKRDEG